MNLKRNKIQIISISILAAGFVFFFIHAKNYNKEVSSSKDLNAETSTQEADKEYFKNASTETMSDMEQMLSKMTLEEKIAQMFIITPEALGGGECMMEAEKAAKEAFDDYPVGGFIYFAGNIETKEQVMAMTASLQEYSVQRIGVPLFISVDEEGGKVARVANDSSIPVEKFRHLSEIGATADVAEAGKLGDAIGSYLSELGFNLDYAPVADVFTNPENTVVKERSFGANAELVSEMALEELRQLEQHGVYGCIKHFPGHGATAGDTHDGFAYTDKSLEEMQKEEFIPFVDAIRKGVSFIMVGHISAPEVVGDNTPSSLSGIMVTEILRNQLGYEGIVITDAMNMGAVSKQYSCGAAAVKAVKAGVDLILMPSDFVSAYNSVVNAVHNGEVPKEQIDESVKRILRIKLKMK